MLRLSRPGQRNKLRSIIVQSICSQQDGITSRSRKKHSGHLAQWRTFLEGIGIDDQWLDCYTIEERNSIICAFAESVRRNEYGKTTLPVLRTSTVSATVNGVCSAFRRNPAIERDGQSLLALKRQLNGYKTLDPAETPQKALPSWVFRTIRAMH